MSKKIFPLAVELANEVATVGNLNSDVSKCGNETYVKEDLVNGGGLLYILRRIYTMRIYKTIFPKVQKARFYMVFQSLYKKTDDRDFSLFVNIFRNSDVCKYLTQINL